VQAVAAPETEEEKKPVAPVASDAAPETVPAAV